MRPHTRSTVAFLCTAALAFADSGIARAATPGLDIDADAGFETGVYNPADSTYGNHLLGEARLNPSIEIPVNATWSLGAGLDGGATFYTRSLLAWDCDGEVRARAIRGPHSLALGPQAGYYSRPSGFDPDQAASSAFAGLRAEYREDLKHPVTTVLASRVLRQPSTSRRDWRTDLRLKVLLNVSAIFKPSLGIGIVRSSSTLASYDYTGVFLIPGFFALIGDKNIVTALAEICPRFYDLQQGQLVAGTGHASWGRAGKKKNVSNAAAESAALFAVATVSYSRKLAGTLDGVVNYEWSLFAANFLVQSLVSHRITLGITWSFGSL
jgi:hypothetical protein